MPGSRELLAATVALLAASSARAGNPAAEDLLEKVDVSHPLYGTTTFGPPKASVFEQPDGSLLLVYQAKYGGDGDHTENRLKLFRFRNGRGKLLLDQNIDYVTFDEKGPSLRFIRGKAVESLCDACDGWDAAEPEDVFFVPIVIDVETLKVRSELSERERTELLARVDRQVRRRVAEQSRHNKEYPAYAASVRGRMREMLVGPHGKRAVDRPGPRGAGKP